MNQAYQLFHEAIPVFTQMKRRGIRIDSDKMQALRNNVENELDEYHDIYRQSEILKRFKQEYKEQFNSGSPNHKRFLFFDMMKLKPLKTSEKTNDPSVDKATLENLKEQVEEGSEIGKILDVVMREAHLNKLLSTYIKGVSNLTDSKGLIHPSFNLHTVDTFRSSSSDPNFQNIPIRNPILSRVRRTMVPQNDWFIEADYAGAEVRMLAIYSDDPVLITFICDGYDFHRYYASLLFEKPENEISKEERYKAKNLFVFPEFYNSYYVTIAKNLGMLESLVEEVEDDLWNKFYRVKRWQNSVVDSYNKCGYVETKLGFCMRGPLSVNNCVNYPIQSSAFHRLLRAVIDIENNMREQQRKSWICGQIHDSIVIDAKDEEIEDCIEVLQYNMIKQVWPWMAKVPMEVEIKIGRNLIDMKEI